jgi:hypothetical protein
MHLTKIKNVGLKTSTGESKEVNSTKAHVTRSGTFF